MRAVTPGAEAWLQRRANRALEAAGAGKGWRLLVVDVRDDAELLTFTLQLHVYDPDDPIRVPETISEQEVCVLPREALSDRGRAALWLEAWKRVLERDGREVKPFDHHLPQDFVPSNGAAAFHDRALATPAALAAAFLLRHRADA